MNTNWKPFRAATLLLFAVFLAGCVSSTPVAPTPDFLATNVQATFQAMTPQATPKAEAISVPTLAPTAAPINIRFNFATGATFGAVQGSLQPGQSQIYVLSAMQGQPFLVSVDSFNHDITLGITGKDGTVLLADSLLQTTWQGALPATQDYYLKLKSGATAENYTLSVTAAARIVFKQGAISAAVAGTTVGGYNVTYALRASAGQTMTINLTAPAGTAALTVWGFSDGQPYLRSVTGSTTFSMTLPTTQDYIIEVVPNGGQVINYSLAVEVK
jgi:hypothetical protein